MKIVEKTNWLVIVNLHAGSSKCKRDWPEIVGILGDYGLKTTVVYTEKPHFATHITIKNIEDNGFRNIIVVGGDGTMNEVVNGVFKQNKVNTTDITLGLITVGTGNDWGRHYGMPEDYNKMVDIIVAGRTFIQDVGMVKYSQTDKREDRFFVNIAGMGYDALVAKKTNDSKRKGRGGMLIYLINLVQSLFQYNHTQLKVVADGKEVFNGKVFSMSIGICKYNGAGMMQLPKAVSDDGLFDVTLIKKTSKFKVMRNIKNLYDGSFVKMKEVETFTGKSFIIEAIPADKLYLETDGESLGHSPLVFELAPKAIKLIVRKNFISD